MSRRHTKHHSEKKTPPQTRRTDDTIKKNQRIVVDPITRIEGHLRIEVEVDGVGNVVEALSAGTQVRGIEIILRGRDPRDAWAFAQRICGVCTLVHGLASVRAVEDALGIQPPPNAELIRDLMAGAQMLQDHVIHFYHLQALDWVNPMHALTADPKAASVAAAKIGYRETSVDYFAGAQTRLKTLVESGQLGIFANGWWDHPGYKLASEVDLIALAHYLEALSWQREIGELLTIFGGKNPHPNVAVGGAPCAISIDAKLPGGGDATAVSLTGLIRVRQLIETMRGFVDGVYLPDLIAIGGSYKDWFTRGENVRNFMTYGDFAGPAAGNGFGVPRGVVLDRDLSEIHPVDLKDPEQIQEFVAHAWYKYTDGQNGGLHPFQGETTLDYTGPKPPFERLDQSGTYTWVKAPRWRAKPMEVGPLARLVLLHAVGDVAARTLTADVLRRLNLPFEAIYSTFGRILARGIESKLLVDRMAGWHDRLMANIESGDLRTFNSAKWNPESWPRHSQGIGTIEGPRGALGHWIVIDDGLITNYQAVVPTTWNAGPMDGQQHGPYEAALLDGHRLVIPDQPLEVLRTIHSFDPCMACAAHVFGPAGQNVAQVKIR
jgi:hydrogenase large subunit